MKKFVSAGFIALVCVLLAATYSPARAQDECQCPVGSTPFFRAAVICIGGVNYNVNISYCTITYAPPATKPPCDNPRAINEWTKLLSICPQVPIPATLQQIVQAAICALSPTGGDYAGFSAVIPNAPAFWSWTLAYPKCMRYLPNGCIGICNTDEQPCCSVRADYWRLPGTGQIAIKTIHPACQSTTTCATQCDNVCGAELGGCAPCP